MTAIDPTLAALHAAAFDDPSACGPLADRYEELGHPEAAALARFGKVSWAHRTAIGPPGSLATLLAKAGRFVVDSGADPSIHGLTVGPLRPGVRPWKKTLIDRIAFYLYPMEPAP